MQQNIRQHPKPAYYPNEQVRAPRDMALCPHLRQASAKKEIKLRLGGGGGVEFDLGWLAERTSPSPTEPDPDLCENIYRLLFMCWLAWFLQKA